MNATPPPPDETALDRRQLLLILDLRRRLFLRDARRRPVQFALRMVAALIGMTFLVGVGGVTVMAGTNALAFGGTPEGAAAADAVVHLTYLFAFLWLAIGPLLAFRANELLDVTKLFAHPVSHHTVFVSSLIGGLTSPSAMIAFVPAAGASIGCSAGAAGALLRLLLAALVVLSGVATGQWLTLVMLNLLRSRVWRDVLFVIGPLFGAGIFVTFQIVARSQDAGTLAGKLGDVLPWLDRLVVLPSWWAARAALAEDVIGALPCLLVPVFLAFTVRAASRLQERAFHGEVVTPLPEAGHRASRRSPFTLLGDPVAALAEKDLKLLFREPMVRMTLIQSAAFALIPIGLTLYRTISNGSGRGPGDLLRALPFTPLACGLVIVAEMPLLLNLLGLEGAGIVQTLQSPVRGAQVLWGKVAAHLALFGGANAVLCGALSFGLYVWAGLPGEGLWRALIAASVGVLSTAVALAVTVVTSVFLPLPMASRDRRALRQQARGREGCLSVPKNMLTMMAIAFATLPLLLLVLHADLLRVLGAGDVLGNWTYLTVPLGLVIAFLIAFGALWAGVSVAGSWFDRRTEKLVSALARDEG